VSILVALSLVVLLGTVGLAIDSGLGYMIKAKLDAAVDGAAIAAGQAVPRGANQAAQISNATQAANAFFAANYPQGYLGSTASLAAPSVTINNGTVTIDLAAQASVPVTLMQVLGFNVLNVASSGEAIRRDLDMAFVVDTTTSMNDATTQAAVRAGSINFLSNFNTTADRVALMHFATGTVVDVPFKSDQSRGFDRTTMTNKIQAYNFNGNTNSVEGMWNAKYQLDHVITQPSSLRVIVFFSDGAPNSFAAKFPMNTACASNSNTVMSGDTAPIKGPGTGRYNNNPGGMADMTKQSTNLTGACYDANANNIARLPDNYDVHAAVDPNSVIPIVTTSPRVVTNLMPTVDPKNVDINATFANVQVKYQNVNRASRNLLEAMASKARDEGIFVFALGYGPYLTQPLGADGEYGQDILKCIANVANGPSRCFNPNQPVGVYCYAATINDIKPCYSQLASAILRISK